MSMQTPLVSVVAPVFNEEDGIAEFYERTTNAMEAITPPVRHELVFVNDGSVDGSLDVLRKIASTDRRARVVDLSRNFGHQLAITSGIDNATGDAVVVIDADLQDPPEVIADMVQKWRDGFKVVYGVRTQRAGENRFKLWTAKTFYRVLNRLSDTPLPVDSGDFRLMDRKVVDALCELREENRYIRGMVSWIGFSQTAVEYARDPRYAGETKYTMRKMVKFAVDGITSFSEKPLRVSIQMGLITCFISLFLALVIVAGKVLEPTSALPGYASLMVVVLFFGGVQLLSIGLLGEYVGRIYRESKRRPLYFVAERLNFSSDEGDANEVGGDSDDDRDGR
ncbi:MAG: polyisoprenyl-phosphate glycosyltransferase [Acidimicrobiaceae bacterium]|jgi:dolichol-phosphate mannosyltransferase|nr:polyisoprenyl-phosphate glycosyltransferase [Acidimicrobiaceae bacterium]